MTAPSTAPATIAGIGCRRGCPAEDIIAIIREAEARIGAPVTGLAAPDFKRHEAGLLAAAKAIDRPIRFIPHDRLAAMQQHCATRSATVQAATGLASVAEAAALAATDGTLIMPRITRGAASCAVAISLATAA